MNSRVLTRMHGEIAEGQEVPEVAASTCFRPSGEPQRGPILNPALQLGRCDLPRR